MKDQRPNFEQMSVSEIHYYAMSQARLERAKVFTEYASKLAVASKQLLRKLKCKSEEPSDYTGKQIITTLAAFVIITSGMLIVAA